MIEFLNIAGDLFSYKLKIHINQTLEPILNKNSSSQFSSHLYLIRRNIIDHLLSLYHYNLVSIDEKYYLLCSLSKSWDLVPLQTWNYLFESFINELHLHSPIQIANIMLIHHRIQHLFHKQTNYNFIALDHNNTRSKPLNEAIAMAIPDYNMITNDYIHSMGLTLLSNNIQLLKPKKIIEITYLATRRNCKSINFYNTVHRHLMGINNLTFGNYTTLVRLNTQVLHSCLSISGSRLHLPQEINDIICVFSNILECVESYNNMIGSKKPVNPSPENNLFYYDLELMININNTFRPKYHSILILDALCSQPILKSLCLLDRHHTQLSANMPQLLHKYHSSISKLIEITLYNIKNLPCNVILSSLRISGSRYSKFFCAREFSCANKEIGNVVSANIENHSNLIALSRFNV